MKTSNQSGSHLIALALFLLAVGVIGFAGYRVYQMQQSASSSDTTSSAATSGAITNTASLNQAAGSLDSANSQINSNLDDTSLDADINTML